MAECADKICEGSPLVYSTSISIRAVLLLTLFVPGCLGRSEQGRARPACAATIILRAWERYEDLRFLQTLEAEVAGLLGYYLSAGWKVYPRQRKIPLLLSDATSLRAVIRIESDGSALPAGGFGCPLVRVGGVSEQGESLAGGLRCTRIATGLVSGDAA